MIRAEDIQLIEARRRKYLKDTYKHILELFTKKIKLGVSLGHKKIYLQVPEFLMGYPLYNHHDATLYLKRQMELLGYNVTLYDYILVVRWGKTKLKEEPEENVEIQDDDMLPSLMNLRKMASKIIQEDRNGGNRRSS